MNLINLPLTILTRSSVTIRGFGVVGSLGVHHRLSQYSSGAILGFKAYSSVGKKIIYSNQNKQKAKERKKVVVTEARSKDVE